MTAAPSLKSHARGRQVAAVAGLAAVTFTVSACSQEGVESPTASEPRYVDVTIVDGAVSTGTTNCAPQSSVTESLIAKILDADGTVVAADEALLGRYQWDNNRGQDSCVVELIFRDLPESPVYTLDFRDETEEFIAPAEFEFDLR